MKKVLVAILSFSFVFPVFAEQLQGKIEEESGFDLEPPQFEEFAPVQYTNPKVKSDMVTAVEEGFGKILVVSLIGLPVGYPMVKHAELRKDSNYWASRKQNFDSAVNYCQSLRTKTKVGNCYEKLRKSELKKTLNWEGQKKTVIVKKGQFY